MFSQKTSEDNWDNELWTGVRCAWGEKKIKYTAEYQTRFNDNYKNLDRWYIEGAIHYLANKYFEIIPDFRYNIRQINNEYRLGLGVVYKTTFNKIMLVNQVKWQVDKPINNTGSWAVREIIYLNYLLTEKWIPYIGGGVFYRKSKTFKGIQVIRTGVGVYYNYNPLHSLSINYFVGQRDLGSRTTYSGIFLLQLTLKFSNKYLYTPAKYINF